MVAHHYTHLTSVMFQIIAEEIGSAHTKTTCIIKGALHPHYSEPEIIICSEKYFSILCDKSNDAAKKMFAIMVRLWDEELEKPMAQFLDMPICNVGTEDNLSSYTDTCLNKRNIPCTNLVGF